ncbi:WD repeat-containing protein [Venturia nashicola]|uniref:WD repeat-containing protein n=1 Tax=Venturia nashicola TaxID=86259 RepID=A0A4Z1PM65_9PEZI|nr:WD repeat-containing protein [Venturia nashicola]TLD38889.1 WD repeat-containing protein [Venturia nashicola]
MSNSDNSERRPGDFSEAADEPHASCEAESGGDAIRPTITSMIRDYLFRFKTDSNAENPNKSTPLAASGEALKRSGRRPEVNVEFKYPLIDIKELDPEVLERYNTRVREMSNRLSESLRAAGRIGTGTFVRDVAEEIVGTDLRTRKHFDQIHNELLGDVGRAFIEEQEQRWAYLGSRPSLISQRINEEQEQENTQTSEWHIRTSEYRPGEKARGKGRVE